MLVFFMSIYCNTVEASNLDDVYISSRGVKINAAISLDWTITCPILQLIFVTLAGGSFTVPAGSDLTLTALMIVSGAVGVFIVDPYLRFAASLLGCAFMTLMTRNMNLMIIQSTENALDILDHYLTKLGQTTIATWLTFPIMWLGSESGETAVANVCKQFASVCMRVGSNLYLVLSEFQYQQCRYSVSCIVQRNFKLCCVSRFPTHPIFIDTYI